MQRNTLRNINGITLIALVITIIVMLILVAVTINMAVNGGLFGYAGNATSQTKAARDEEKNYTELEPNMTTNQLIEKFTTNGKKWTHTGTGAAVGDVYTTGTESFYLIASDSTTITLLAVNCVDTRVEVESVANVNYNKQTESTYTVAFDNTQPYSNIYSESTIKPLVDSYVSSLNVDVVEGRLMTLEEVGNLQGNLETGSTSACPEFLNAKNFWLRDSGHTSGTNPTAYRFIGSITRIDGGMPRSKYE